MSMTEGATAPAEAPPVEPAVPPATDPPATPPSDPAVSVTPPEPKSPVTDWRDKEISAKHRQIKELQRQLDEARAKLEATPAPPAPAAPPPEPGALPAPPPAAPLKSESELRREIDAAAEEKAAVLVEQRTFEQQATAVVERGAKAYGDKWAQALDTIEKLNGLPADDLRFIVEGADHPEQVIYELGTNPALFQALRDMSRAKRHTEFVKLGMEKPATGAKAPPNTPLPVEPVGGRPSAPAPAGLSDELEDAVWYERRLAEKRASKGRAWSANG